MKFKQLTTFYGRKLTHHVWRFMQSHHLVNPKGCYLLSASAGVDSQAMLHLFHALLKSKNISSLRVIHFHHGNRKKQQDAEFNFLKEKCHKLGIEFIGVHAQSLPKSNFEQAARDFRNNQLKLHKKAGETIVKAQHIDDSYEWHLLQSSRSSSLISSLGIPLKNGAIIRPFHCLTKEQIYHFAQLENITWIEDPTNAQNQYQRNYLRNEVVSKIAQAHPKYLKHFVHRQNKLAKELGVHINDSSAPVVLYDGPEASLLDFSNGLELAQVEKRIKKFSDSKRGQLSDQLTKLKESFDKNKRSMFLFSGGVHAYVMGNVLLISKEKIFLTPKAMNPRVERMSLTQFENRLKDRLKGLSFTDSLNSNHFLINVRKEKYFGKDLKGLKYLFDLKLSQLPSESGLVWENAFTLLQKWRSKERLRNRQLCVSLCW